MIRISNDAQMYLSKLLLKQKKKTQIRVFVTNPGTQHAECGISYCSPNDVKVDDIILKFEKLVVYIDQVSALYLTDAEIDFVNNHLGSELTLKAPNVKKNEISNNAPLKERVEYFLQLKINPQLARHGGYVSLIEITDNNHAILQFGGNCNGCPMVDVTFKRGVENQLLNEFQELKGVQDLTDHQKGKHFYC